MRFLFPPHRLIFSMIGTAFLILLVLTESNLGQSRNSITGHVFGADRRPLSDIHVELLDDLSRPIARQRTNASGRYFFSGLSSGRFKVRVLPLGTDYEEHEEEVELINFARPDTGGGVRPSGFSSEQRDFYLRARRGVVPGMASAVFVQDVPPDAKKFFDTALTQLDEKKAVAAYASLRSAIEVFPKYYAALELLGTEYVKAGHFQAAQVLLSIAVDVNPRGSKSWYGLAIALYSQSMRKEALAASEKAFEINPSSPEILALSGSLLRQEKRYKEAETRLLKAVEISHDTIPDVHWELALLFGNGLKRYKDAARELKLYLKARPDHKNAENIKKLIVEFEEKGRTSEE